MCLKLSEVNLLVSFFREYIRPHNKSIKNIVDKIDYFDEEDGILKDQPKKETKVSMRCSCPCNCEA